MVRDFLHIDYHKKKETKTKGKKKYQQTPKQPHKQPENENYKHKQIPYLGRTYAPLEETQTYFKKS